MLIRRRHKLQALRLRRLQPDDFEPAVMVGPVLLFRRDPWDGRLVDELIPRRQINGRWLSGKWASHAQWLSSIGHRGSRRGDPRTTKQQKAAERCALYRYTCMPF